MPYKDSQKKKEHNRKYHLAHREKCNEYSRKWRANNPKKQRESDRKWREANRETILEAGRVYARKYNVVHRKERCEYLRKWSARNRDKIRVYALRRTTRIKGASGSCSCDQLQARIAFYGGLCWIPGCGKAYEAIDHVIPLSKGGSNWPANLRPICKSHNSRKRTKSVLHYLQEIQ